MQRTVDLSKKRDLDIKSITMRTTNGHDTLDAAGRCIPVDGRSVDQNVFGLTMRQQTVAGAILNYTKPDGTLVDCGGAPCLDSVGWSTRTREYVGEIYDYLNGMSFDEREGFRKELATGSAQLNPT